MKTYYLVLVMFFFIKAQHEVPYLKGYTNVRDFTISENGVEVYFTQLNKKKAAIYVIKKHKGIWGKAVKAEFSNTDYNSEPFLSPDNNTLFFASTRTIERLKKYPKILTFGMLRERILMRIGQSPRK